MKICYFGDYNPEYNRTRVLLKGLRRVGVEVVECRTEKKGYKKYFDLYKKLRVLRGDFDVLLVGYSDSRYLPFFAQRITRKPVVYDPIFSLYDSWVFDRQLVGPKSLKAKYYWFVDWFSCWCSDLVLLDVKANADYYSREFHLPREKFIHVLVGADDEVLHPIDTKRDPNTFHVELHGRYIPLHGIEYIIRAAKILEKENIHFTLIGGGQDAKKAHALAEELRLKNVEFVPFVPYEELPRYIATADVCFGIVSTVPRVEYVLPNKIYETAAMGRVSINADSIALRDGFKDGVNVLACKKGDPEDIAKKILYLKNNPLKKEEMERNVLRSFKEQWAPEKVVLPLIAEIKKRFHVA